MQNSPEEFSSPTRLQNTSKIFRKKFLAKFVLELIKHSKGGELLKLEKIVDKVKVKKIPQKNKDPYFLSLMHLRDPKHRSLPPLPPKKNLFYFKPLPTPQKVIPKVNNRPPTPRSPRIPEYPLPPRLNYLKPYPTQAQIDLGKINILSQDPNVRTIECNGPEEFILVKGSFGLKTTNIALNKDEINHILNSFSQASKIPLNEGVIKIIAGRFILSAIVSDVIGSKFIIRKMASPTPINPFSQKRF